MLRIRKKQKPSKIKARSKLISDSINVEKTQLEGLKKDKQVLIKNLKKIGKDIELKNTEKEKLEKVITKKIEKSEKIEGQIKGKLVELLDVMKETKNLNKVKEEKEDKIEQEASEKQKELKKDMDVSQALKNVLDIGISALGVELGQLTKQEESISKTLIDKSTKLKIISFLPIISFLRNCSCRIRKQNTYNSFCITK